MWEGAGIPVVDISGLVAGAPDGLAAAAASIGAAARGPGFFSVVGHGMPRAAQAKIFAESARFFALPAAEKARLALSADNRGYVGLKGESLDPSKPPDLKEAFNIGLDLAADDERVLAGEPFRGVNLWPALPGWRETMLGYFDAVWGLGRLLHRAIAHDLAMPADFFEDKLDEPMATLRLLHYPARPPEMSAGQLGAGEHTDYGNITLLLTDDAGGLEVKRRDGGWIAVPSVDGAFICNIGDCLMRWTNDVYASTPHRVVNPAGRERYSVAFFLDPNPDAIVSALPSCVTPGRARAYPPVAAADYLRDRLARTYAPRPVAAG